jgi:penicillin-binding protein 2
VVGLESEKAYENGEELPPEFLDHAWFVAVAPVENPALAIAILIEHGGHGGSAAAPIAKQMIQAYLGKEPGQVPKAQALIISH